MFSVLMEFISQEFWQAQAGGKTGALIPAGYRHEL